MAEQFYQRDSGRWRSGCLACQLLAGVTGSWSGESLSIAASRSGPRKSTVPSSPWPGCAHQVGVRHRVISIHCKLLPSAHFGAGHWVVMAKPEHVFGTRAIEIQ